MTLQQLISRAVYKGKKSFKKDFPVSQLKSGHFDALLLGSIEYMNYGDQAINVAEYGFFSRRGVKFIEIPESYIDSFLDEYSSFIGSDKTIYLSGGGNMGDVWLTQEVFRQKVFETFPQNKIVIFPQSVNYKNQDSKMLKKTLEAVRQVRNLTIMLRDRYSYNFVRDNFPSNVKVFLVPDMVLTIDARDEQENIHTNIDVLTYMRKDVEKLLDKDKDSYIEWLTRNSILTVKSEDTVRDTWKYISIKNRKKFVEEKLNETRKSKLVVTDRLHGMLFAYITGTPAIVFDNNNHKILNLYKTWLSNCPYIYMANGRSLESLISITDDLLALDEKFYPDTEHYIRSLDDAIS